MNPIEESNRVVMQASHLTKSYKKGPPVLNDLNLSVVSGQTVGLVGENGSGKSTLLKCLLGLLKPTSGSARIADHDSWALPNEVKSELGYVPQVVKLIPWISAQQMIEYAACFYPHWDHTYTQQLISRWNIPEEKKVTELSSGQLQRLGIICALGHRPSLLILDEPVASLDPVGRREFLRSLFDLAANQETTVLFSTHITSDLERVASHVALLKAGQISVYEELGQLKERVKKLRLISSSEIPEIESFTGLIHAEVQGRSAELIVDCFLAQDLATLASRYQAEVITEDLNLEEICIQLYGDSSSTPSAPLSASV